MISGCNPSEIFQAAEGILDFIPLLVRFLAETEWLLAVALVWDDGLRPGFLQSVS